MYKIAAMGDRDSISGFTALGIEIFPIEDAASAVEYIKKMTDGGYAVIYITEALAAKIPDEIVRYRDISTPAIILIPGIVGNTGVGMANVRKIVEKAVGSDILS